LFITTTTTTTTIIIIITTTTTEATGRKNCRLKKNKLLQSYVNSQCSWSNIMAPSKQCHSPPGDHSLYNGNHIT
jgi:hypothetical protein